MQVLQVGQGSFGRGKKVAAFIDVTVNGESIGAPGLLDELPVADGALGRTCMGKQGAFDDRNIFKIFRHVMLGQHLFNIREISAGTLEP